MRWVQNRDDIVVFDETSAAIHEEPSGLTNKLLGKQKAKQGHRHGGPAS